MNNETKRKPFDPIWKTIETRHFPDSANCINDILMYLMSQQYSIIELTPDEDNECFNVQLLYVNETIMPTLKRPKRYAYIEIDSEGATMQLCEMI